jgi:hypothetical protein
LAPCLSPALWKRRAGWKRWDSAGGTRRGLRNFWRLRLRARKELAVRRDLERVRRESAEPRAEFKAELAGLRAEFRDEPRKQMLLSSPG